MDNSSLLLAFHRIDKDGDGVISHNDLVEFSKVEEVSPNFVNRWISLFDTEGTGTITFDSFCCSLGINSKAETRVNFAPKVKVYKTNMIESVRETVLRALKVNWNNVHPDNSIGPTTKMLDQKIGPRWQGGYYDDINEPKLKGEYYVFSLDSGTTKYVIWRFNEDEGINRACCLY